MKFSNGCWLQKEGYECSAPQEVYYTTVENNKVTLCAPTTKIRHRGDTLGGVNLTLVITSPAPEVIRLQTYHYLGTTVKGPAFELEQNECLPLDTTETDSMITIKSGTLTLEITKDPWSMSYKRDGELITKAIGRDLACMKTNWKGLYHGLRLDPSRGA